VRGLIAAAMINAFAELAVSARSLRRKRRSLRRKRTRR
jgi:hypothetical protein